MRVPKAYFCQIAGHISFILFSYFGEDLVFRPVHIDNLFNTRQSATSQCGEELEG
jgi:hypothetical protein